MKLLSTLLSVCVACVAGVDPDVGKGVVSLVIERGYPITEHFVQTDDGYILSLFRIPHGREPPAENTTRPVVLLQHGLEDSSFTWVSNFADQSLAYLLADSGFDVFLGNNRGSTYSKNHAWLPVDSKEFWDFTWDEMAKYDLPSNVLFITELTGADSIGYVGHSEGTMQAFAGLTINQTVADKVNSFVALAPVAYDGHMTSPLLKLMILLGADKVVQFFGFKQFLPSSTILQKLDPYLCSLVPTGCDDLLFLIVGYGQDLNNSRLPVYLSQTPAGSSVKNIAHFAQGARSGKWQMYDYGCGILSCKNKRKYGQRTPPQYNLSALTVPTALFYSDGDCLADPIDVGKIYEEVPEGTIVFSKHLTDYNHMDFVWGAHANTKVYPDVIKVLKLYAIHN